MKLLLPPAFLFLLSAPARDEVALVFAPEEGTVLKRTFEARAEYRLADMVYAVDGEPIEGQEDLPEYSMRFLEKIAVTDELVAVDGGWPTELVRRFDELLQETTFAGGQEERTTGSGSDLEGRSVRFTWDEDEEEYTVGAADDEELEEQLADWLAEDMDLRAVLPAGEVEVGDEWELDPALYLAFMWPSGLLDFRDEGEEVSDEDRRMNQETIERLEGSGRATLEEVREEDGLRLAVIQVELQITTGCDGVMESGEQEVEIEVEIERELGGTILWDLEHGHVHSAELEAEASRQTTRSGKIEMEDGEIELEESELLEGKIEYQATIERE